MSSELIRILGLIAVVSVFSVLLKDYRPEYSMLLILATSVAVLILIFEKLIPVISSLKSTFEKSGLAAEYFSVALKALGISYISGFVADTCRDFGHTALASKAELAGKCAVFILSFPLLVTVLETALGFAGL